MNIGFRGISTDTNKIKELSSKLKNIKANVDNGILPICRIDFPYGNSSLDIRAYSITSAKENRCKRS